MISKEQKKNYEAAAIEYHDKNCFRSDKVTYHHFHAGIEHAHPIAHSEGWNEAIDRVGNLLRNGRGMDINWKKWFNDELQKLRKCDSYERKIDKMNAKMADIEAQLSSKEQECEELKKRYNDATERNVDLRAEREELYTRIKTADFEMNNVRAENERLKSNCEDWKGMIIPIIDWGQNHGRENGMRPGEDIPKKVLEMAQSVKNLRKRCEDLEAANKQNAIEFATYMDEDRWKFDHQEQITHSFQEHYEHWKLLSQ